MAQQSNTTKYKKIRDVFEQSKAETVEKYNIMLTQLSKMEDSMLHQCGMCHFTSLMRPPVPEGDTYPTKWHVISGSLCFRCPAHALCTFKGFKIRRKLGELVEQLGEAVNELNDLELQEPWVPVVQALTEQLPPDHT